MMAISDYFEAVEPDQESEPEVTSKAVVGSSAMSRVWITGQGDRYHDTLPHSS